MMGRGIKACKGEAFAALCVVSNERKAHKCSYSSQGLPEPDDEWSRAHHEPTVDDAEKTAPYNKPHLTDRQLLYCKWARWTQFWKYQPLDLIKYVKAMHSACKHIITSQEILWHEDWHVLCMDWLLYLCTGGASTSWHPLHRLRRRLTLRR